MRFSGLVCLNASLVALAGWVGTGRPIWILLAAPLAVVALLSQGRRTRIRAVACAALLTAVMAALAAQFHLASLARHWPERSRASEAAAQAELQDALYGLLRRAEAATSELSDLWASGSIPDLPRLPAGLRGSGVDALALFGPSGELVGWEGTHQGPVPESVRSGEARYLYEEGALFGYLYVTQEVPGVGTAVAASLLTSDLPAVLASPPDDFVSRFRDRTGANLEIVSGERATEGNVWDLVSNGESLLSVSLSPPSEAEARRTIELGWSRAVAVLLLLAWFLAVVDGRAELSVLIMGGAALPLILLLFPLGRLSGRGEIFSPADLLLPGPLPLTLGDILTLGASGAVLLGLLPWARRWRLPRGVTIVIATLFAVGGLELLQIGASRDLLAGSELGWLAYQVAAVGVALLSFAIAMVPSSRDGEPRVRAVPLGVWLGAAVLLSFGWAFLVGRVVDPPWWLGLLWGIPLWGVVRSIPSQPDWRVGLLRWASLTALAVTLSLPWSWEARVGAQMRVAEERVERLGTRSDPFLEFLLLRAGERAETLSESGRDPVEVLYRAWTDSGLAAEGFPLWVTYWSLDEVPQEELRIGVSDPRPTLPEDLVAAARSGEGVVVRRFDLADAHYMAVAPLARGAVLSIIVPPRRLLGGTSALGPLFAPARSEPDPLVLVPLLPGEVPGETEGIRWIPSDGGWQGETFVAYPDEVYHAYYLLELPGWVLLVARGSLVFLLNMLVLGIPWGLGRWLREGRLGSLRSQLAALGSFRGRVTLALFGFFMVPSVVFGTLAYRTLAAAATRTAESLAERAVEDAGASYSEVQGAVDLLANRVGSDLLLYENGELVAGSLPELVQLGLYQGWIPVSIQEVMARGEAVTATTTASLGGWEYVVAYRRMPGGRVLAAPAPLQAGATALRRRDIADLIGFSVVLGGLLSVLLALAVGRALARPIHTLRVASERVGAGNMSVHLPEGREDEFGAVFDAFNRMVDRLADTRSALLRTSRRTRAIVEEVPTGVVALDRRGRVALASSRVEKLLGAPLERGHRIPRGEEPGDPRSALADWVDGYFRDELSEAGTELSFGERRVRVRARRISRKGPLGGAVLTLEDITDELRSERILAWGEMAQQVAHEVKNPLTPIKLGVQHIRRAWADRQPDYEGILNRNVDAILKEIDRLATIASSFSTYGAPTPAGAEPLEEADVLAVVEDVLDLYRVGRGPVAFTLEESDGAPAAQARPSELKEVLVNLLENARAALPQGGEVRIRVESVEGEIELSVADGGTGVPPEILARIFEPHFSTRSGGTGLGLAIVRRLVESWGGRVYAESEPGKGTIIRIRMLPWAGEPAATPKESRADT